MTINAGLTALIAKRCHKAPLSPFGLACCCLYAAYGLRLSTFLARRHLDDSYTTKFNSLQMKSDMMGFGSKFAIVTGVSFSQALYALPLAIATSPAATRAPRTLRSVGWAGVGIAAVGLLLETAADEQKLAGKRSDPQAPVMDGLYSYCKHPNYLGEFIFHCGISCMGATGNAMKVAACVFPTFFMAVTLQNSARRLDREADHRYKDIAGFANWASSTPTLFPFVHAISQKASGDPPQPSQAAGFA
eukprot:CAMPEP_0172723522 /NCGR_PEP_ID=MMETSP1074-20121228/83938_1 /TAXON_ID=2916 /ORGANISM="Ceratium fusus, Strain PA161109" /LENGTH=245 /DNA_ID=CAMNT_0013549781 /DNA_START=169 /DNA_END=904 /DNA_ORIENTATION=+